MCVDSGFLPVMKRKDNRQRQGPREKYRITNWPAYNAGLIARGDVTVWMETDQEQQASAGPCKRGRPCVYADATIQMLLGLKQVFRLSLRALQGFAASLAKLGMPDLRVPNYTTLCRRARDLQVTLPVLRAGEALHLVVDSTGLKVFGEGEWKVRKHGSSKRRTWRKVHLAMDVNTGQVCAALMTHQGVGDAEVLPALLDQIPPDAPIDIVGGDGAYDTKACHAAIAARAAQPSIPPREGAALWRPRMPGAAWRNEAISAIASSGRRKWKAASGYHRRSLAETLMYRLKVLTGRELAARTVGAQASEVAVRVGVLNRMTALARPQSVRMA